MAAIQFLLNEQRVALTNTAPNTTLLQYLRQQQQLTGTKEGCASGDCGACSVVMVEQQADGLQYQAINACICLVASLHGKQIITVEHLQQQQALHPVQQAMVQHHGSQCGFCTPGFIMSAFALSQQQPEQLVDRHAVVEALAGNLCRCTGYRPIIDAIMACADSPETQQAINENGYSSELFEQQQQQISVQLEQLNTPTTVELSSEQQTFHAPTSLAELSSLFEQQPTAKLLAGGTDLALQITQQLQTIADVIYLGRVAELRQISETDQQFMIGAGVTYQQLTPVLAPYYPELVEMISRLGSPQIRNVGTIGGNIGNASPIGDMPPALIALNAELVLRQGSQTRRLAIDEFFIDYKVTALQTGEFIQQICVPKTTVDTAQQQHFFKVYKVSKRLDDDISALLMAINLTISSGVICEVSMALGGMAAIPKRAIKCQQALINQPWQASTIKQAQLALTEDFQPMSDVRASAEYRMLVAQNLLQKCFIECQQAIASAEHKQAFGAPIATQTIATKVTHYA